jgi:PIN domain nuclease of toxin-antitoxin system
MKLLLDTHTFLGLASGPEKLSHSAIAACENPTNQLYLSVVSAWEIQIKRQIGRLQLDVPLDQMIQAQQAANDLQILPVELHHVYVLNELPLHHHDPFDRLLIAQATAEQAWLVSTDSQFEPYPVPVIW